MFQPQIIHKLQENRRKTFATYDEINLDKDALRVFARLFLNPDCQSDIELLELEKKEVKLSYLGDHIITAGPSTVAQYAESHKLLIINEQDLLECFALDHAHDVFDNKVADSKNASYALAHILLMSRVDSLKLTADTTIATLSTTTSWGKIVFQHVMVPKDMTLEKAQYVYHHFGVVVALARDRKFARKINELQQADKFIAQLGREAAQKKVVIDFADEKIFQKDVLGMMLKPTKVKKVKDPGDLKNMKIRFKN